MLKLVNIKMDKNTISAEYIPEGSSVIGYAEYNADKKDGTWKKEEQYGSMYGRMAVNGLKAVLDDLKQNKISDIPKEKYVVWY